MASMPEALAGMTREQLEELVSSSISSPPRWVGLDFGRGELVYSADQMTIDGVAVTSGDAVLVSDGDVLVAREAPAPVGFELRWVPRQDLAARSPETVYTAQLPRGENPLPSADEMRGMAEQLEARIAQSFAVPAAALQESAGLIERMWEFARARARYENDLVAFGRAEVPLTATPYEAWYGGMMPPGRGGQRKAAEERGEKLLREWLTPEQLAQYDARGDFEVRGEASGRRYRIVRGASFNVLELDSKGRIGARICFMPEGDLVFGDMMLAQKIALETNERAALDVANRDDTRWGYMVGCGCAACRSEYREQRRTVGEWRNLAGETVAAPAPITTQNFRIERREEPRAQPRIDPNSWMANWGSMGRALLAEREQGRSSRRGRRRR
ncbi:hypothetical protein ACVWW6_006010 [Bradyrhizobium sp. USDA 3311]